VGERIVDKGCPEQGKDDVCAELDPLGNSRCHDCHRECCKDQLEYHEQETGYGLTERSGTHADIIQSQVLEVPNEPTNIGSKSKRVPDHYPLDADQCKGYERQGDHGDQVFPANKSPIKESYRRRHEHDKCR